MLSVCWINPQTVVIYVFVFFGNAIEALTPVDTYVSVSVHAVHRIYTRRVCDELYIVVTACLMTALFAPALATIRILYIP